MNVCGNRKISWIALAVANLVLTRSSAAAESGTIDLGLLIDRSGSMGETDPLGLSGIGAARIVEIVELSGGMGRVRVKLVFYGSTVRATEFLSPDEARKVLRDELPPPEGATDMLGAVEEAFAALADSTADRRIIGSIGDGMPDPNGTGNDEGQIDRIRNELVPAIAGAGIEMYSLGFSQHVDRAFLEEMAQATGGRAVVVDDVEKVLPAVGRLFAGRDVHAVLDEPESQVADGTEEVAFSLPGGIDRALVTFGLNQPRVFLQGEIEAELSGDRCPAPLSETFHMVQAADPQGSGPAGGASGPTTAAWSALVPGSADEAECTLRVTSKKPGWQGHGGLQVTVLVRAAVEGRLVCRPTQAALTFGEEFACEVVLSASGSRVDRPQIAAATICADGNAGQGCRPLELRPEGIYGKALEVAGPQVVRVMASPDDRLPPIQLEWRFRATPPAPARLDCNLTELDIAVGPHRPTAERKIECNLRHPEGSPHPISLTADVHGAAARLISLTIDGRTQKATGIETTTLREGARTEITLTTKLDAKKGGSLGLEEGAYEGFLELASPDLAAPVRIAFVVRITTPSVAVGCRQFIDIYWSPALPRELDLCDVAHDAEVDGEFWIEPRRFKLMAGDLTIGECEVLGPDAESRPPQGPKRAGERFPLTRQPTTVRARCQLDDPLPDGVGGGAHDPVSLRVASSWGTEQRVEIAPVTVPPSPFPWVSFYAMHLALLGLGGAGFLLSYASARSLGNRYRWRRHRAGSILDAGSGVIGSGVEGAGLELRSDERGRLSDGPLGRLRFADDGLTLFPADPEHMLLNGAPIAGPTRVREGDVVTIQSERGDELWVLEYLGPSDDGGSFAIDRCPLGGSAARTVLWAAIGLGALLLVRAVIVSSSFADVAYRIPLLEALYRWALT